MVVSIDSIRPPKFNHHHHHYQQPKQKQQQQQQQQQHYDHQSPPSPPSSSNKRHQSLPAQPVLRYSQPERLIGVLRVRTLLTTRRRLVRLENGVVHIHAQGDECGEPLMSSRLTEAESITADDSKAVIVLRTEHRVTITLVFKHDVSLLYVWLNAMRRARDMQIHRFYKLCEQIGSGHYAKVYRAVERCSGQMYAVKVVPKQHKDPKVRQYAKREAEIVRHVCHPNVVSTIDVFETADTVYIVMEYIENGNLLEFLASGRNRINEKNALRIARQLFQAIAYLHSNDIIHRDIKAENILLTKDGNIKVADFGLARRLDGVGSDEYCLSSILGTPAYCSPEVVLRLSYGKPVDLFGCGVLLYIALSGALPFKGSTPAQVFEAISKAKLTFPRRRWAMISPEARNLVQKLLSHRASDRPTAEEALQHMWFKSTKDMGRAIDVQQPMSSRPFVRNSSARAFTGNEQETNKMMTNNNNNNPSSTSTTTVPMNNNNNNNIDNKSTTTSAAGANANNYNHHHQRGGMRGVHSMRAGGFHAMQNESVNSSNNMNNNGPHSVNANHKLLPRVTSTSSFRRAQSGSLRQLTLEKMKQRAGQIVV